MIPDNFKIRIEDRETPELKKMYDLLFDDLMCGWAGRVGHYAYGHEHQVADPQDGFIYGWKTLDGKRLISADPFYGNPDYPEITWRT